MKLWEIILVVIPALVFVLICLPSLIRAIGLNVGEIAFLTSTFVPLLVMIAHALRVRRLVQLDNHLERLFEHCDSPIGLRITERFRDCPSNDRSLRPSKAKLKMGRIRTHRDLKFWGSLAIRLAREDSNTKWILYEAHKWCPPILERFEDDAELTAQEWQDLNTILYWFRYFHHLGQEVWVKPLLISVAFLQVCLFLGLGLSIVGTGSPALQLAAGLFYLVVPLAWGFLSAIVDEFLKIDWCIGKFLASCFVGISGITNLVLGTIGLSK